MLRIISGKVPVLIMMPTHDDPGAHHDIRDRVRLGRGIEMMNLAVEGTTDGGRPFGPEIRDSLMVCLSVLMAETLDRLDYVMVVESEQVGLRFLAAVLGRGEL